MVNEFNCHSQFVVMGLYGLTAIARLTDRKKRKPYPSNPLWVRRLYVPVPIKPSLFIPLNFSCSEALHVTFQVSSDFRTQDDQSDHVGDCQGDHDHIDKCNDGGEG